jgi:hypothetical protein
MANIARGGFHWVGGRDGCNTMPIQECVVADNNTLAIFFGDSLTMHGTSGDVYPSAAGDYPDFVCIGVKQYLEASTNVVRAGRFLPAATRFSGVLSPLNPQASVLLCVPTPRQKFEVCCDTAVATLTAAQVLVNYNANHVATAGSTTTGQSGHVLNSSTAATTNTLTWRIIEVVRQGNMNDSFNDVTLVNWRVIVEANLSHQASPGAIAGV